MIHEVVDLAHWKTLFPLAQSQAQGERFTGGETILGPRSLALFEQVRDEAAAVLAATEQLPTDIFIWARGEGARREITKIGGLPYRTHAQPWPQTATGEPLTFLAQINFADSRDIVPNLPGDILLIFAEGKPFHNKRLIAKDEYLEFTSYYFQWGIDEDPSQNSAIIFEWVRMNADPLVATADIPQTGWQLNPYHAQIYRTWDYPAIDPWDYPEVANYIPALAGATKIGGSPAWVQDQEDISGTFLCAIDSFCYDVYLPYTLLNSPEPQPKPTEAEWRDPAFFRAYMEASAREQPNDIMWGDCGTCYLFINAAGDIEWTVQGH